MTKTARLEALHRQVASLLAEIDRMEKETELPEEPPIGAVIKFDVMFARRGYSYVAFRAYGDRWYTTGSTAPTNVRWRDLIVWMKENNVVSYQTPVSSGPRTMLLEPQKG